MAQQPKSGLGRLIVEVSRPHTDTHSVGPLWSSDQLVAQAAAYTKQNKDKILMCKPSAEFEPAVPVIKRPNAYASDRAATGIGTKYYWSDQIEGNELGGTCGAYDGEEKCIQGLGREIWKKQTTRKTQA